MKKAGMKKSKDKAKDKDVIVVKKKKKRIPVAKKPPKIEPKRKAYNRSAEKKKIANLDSDDN
ncbi:MAG: hypothetical protein IPM56_00930 [Ignavibacteriales bacterium]|nr:MAG: hypothetical protein IPM56_00930 [Ignavibacteriales bacterium]